MTRGRKLRAMRRGAALAVDEAGDTLIRFHVARGTRWDQAVVATFESVRRQLATLYNTGGTGR